MSRSQIILDRVSVSSFLQKFLKLNGKKAVDVIGSLPLLFSPVGEPESVTKPALVDTGPLERGDITIAQPTYVLFPTDNPFDDSD